MLARFKFSLLLIGTLSAAFAQETRTPDDPLQEYLIAPELVMEHQHTISLSDVQKTSIKNEVITAQSSFFEMHWDLKEQMNQFATLLGEEKINETKALAQLDQVLGIESKIKRAQMTLMIRIKNYLTPEQQKKLREIKSSSQ